MALTPGVWTSRVRVIDLKSRIFKNKSVKLIKSYILDAQPNLSFLLCSTPSECTGLYHKTFYERNYFRGLVKNV
jgi:hypothetical protein